MELLALAISLLIRCSCTAAKSESMQICVDNTCRCVDYWQKLQRNTVHTPSVLVWATVFVIADVAVAANADVPCRAADTT